MIEAVAGSARLDGLLNLSFPPDPAAERRVRPLLARIAAAVPVPLNAEVEPGLVTIMPESDAFRFDAGRRPGEALLPLLRELADELGPDLRGESTLRVQEFAGDTVREGVFLFEDGEITLTARERPMRPEERPTLAPPGFADRAEGFLRRNRLALALAAALLVLVGWIGWQQGWWSVGAGAAAGPAIDAGPLEGVLEIRSVRWAGDALRFEIAPGADYGRYEEVAKGCSLRPGLFRVVLEFDGTALPQALVLDLRKLPERMKAREGDDPLEFAIPARALRFDRVLISE